jgi:cerevisin
VQELNATWGLARISHAEPYQTTYLYDSSAGEGTCAYVIGHVCGLLDFSNKVNVGMSLTQASRSSIRNSKGVCMSGLIRLIRADDLEGAFFLKDFTDEGTMIDGQGHGTHVAGTIGSVTWGVAKKTTLLAVRVLDSLGFGTTAGVLAGMNYVVTDAKARRDAGQCPNGIVANMSLGGRRLQAMNDAVSNSFPVFRSSLLTLI